MKVVVTAQGRECNPKIAPHFARPHYFHVIDIGHHTLTV